MRVSENCLFLSHLCYCCGLLGSRLDTPGRPLPILHGHSLLAECFFALLSNLTIYSDEKYAIPL